MAESNQKHNDEIGFFAGSLILIVFLVIIVALIVGLVTITRTWERTDIRFHHRDGSFSVVKKTWWGLSKEETAYIHRNSGWNYVDKEANLRPMVDIDETIIDIKDASKQPGKTTVLKSGVEAAEKQAQTQ